MPERIRAVQHRWRRGSERAHRATSREQIADESFSAGNQLVSEDVPGTSLDTSVLQRGGDVRCALRSDVEVVLQHDGLPVEEEAAVARTVQNLVDQRDELLPEAFGRVIPLAIPVGVGDDVDGDEHRENLRCRSLATLGINRKAADPLAPAA
jgi:hypothetical protein